MPSLLLMILLALVAAAAPGGTVYVSPTGSDAGPGTRSHPFATPARARNALRSLPVGTARRVVLRGGLYCLKATLDLDARDSGTVWEASSGETPRLIGGVAAGPSRFGKVADPALLARLKPEAREHVLAAQLADLGTSAPPFPSAYHGAPPGPELFVDGLRLRPARWPNEGWATISRITAPGSRPRDGDTRGLCGSFEYSGDEPGRWRADEGVWLQGYWCYDWYDEVIRVASVNAESRTITLAAPHLYGLMQGNPSPRRYRAINVLEELDQPGEFVISSRTGTLYYWPPAGGGAETILSTLDAPIVRVQDATRVVLRGLRVEAGLDTGIEIQRGSGCRVERCEVRNTRHMGVVVLEGLRHTVSDCSIHHTGTGGLMFSGGDRRTLTPAGHQALRNHIHHFSELQLTGAYGIQFGGVGNVAANNLIHDAPHQAILLAGNDHLFQRNEVHHICTETDDCGALYKGRNPSCRGNRIVGNYFHDIGSTMGHGSAAIYFDDGDGGDFVIGNLFVRCGDPGRGGFGTVFSHGGHGIVARGNLFVDCKRALGSVPWDDARWRRALAGGEDCFFPDKMLKEVDVTRAPYLTHYPELVGYMDPPPGAERSSHAAGNVFVRCGERSGGNWKLDGTNWSTDRDPGFVNAAAGDYRLRDSAEMTKRAPSFEPIPVERIGLPRGGR